MLRVFTAFSGYDSQCLALNRIGIDYNLVGWSEIDKYAIMTHNALFPQFAERNYGDISRIDWHRVPDFDLFTYSFPCTDISIAGQQKGLAEGSGTRSSLLWECRKAIETKCPRFLLMENVKALAGKRFKANLNEWLALLQSLGYRNYARVLDAKDYGVPQHRERLFVVSTLDPNLLYAFPCMGPLNRVLADIIGKSTNERFAKIIQVGNLVESKGRFTNPQRGRVYDIRGIAPTLTTAQGGGLVPKVLCGPTLRQLTPRECFRLMGLTESEIDTIQATGISNSQQYKLAGNSIVVDVLAKIFANLLIKE